MPVASHVLAPRSDASACIWNAGCDLKGVRKHAVGAAGRRGGAAQAQAALVRHLPVNSRSRLNMVQSVPIQFHSTAKFKGAISKLSRTSLLLFDSIHMVQTKQGPWALPAEPGSTMEVAFQQWLERQQAVLPSAAQATGLRHRLA